MRMGSRVPTRYVLVPGPVIMPGLSPSTRPTRSLTVAVFGKSGSIQLMAHHRTRSRPHSSPPRSRDAQVAPLDVLGGVERGRRPLVHDLSLAHHVDPIRH